MKTHLPLLSFWMGLLALDLTTPTQAAESGHELSVGAGIASPSSTSALDENPAGLVYNAKPSLEGFVESPNDQLDPIEPGAGLFLGNGTVGAGVSLKGQQNRSGLLTFGLAAQVDALNTSIGVDGHHTLSTGAGWDWDLGIIHAPKSGFRVGAAAFGVDHTPMALGLGLASDVNSSATFALDGSMDTNGNGLTLKPGLAVHVSDLQMAAGYGIELDSNRTSWIRDGFSLGLGFKINEKFHLEGYYNQLARYFLGLVIHL